VLCETMWLFLILDTSSTTGNGLFKHVFTVENDTSLTIDQWEMKPFSCMSCDRSVLLWF
jgi:hypothetical protein